jgi:hypothetical protein
MAWRRRPPFIIIWTENPPQPISLLVNFGEFLHISASHRLSRWQCVTTHTHTEKTDKNSERAGRNEPLSWAFGRTRDAKRRNGWRWPCGDWIQTRLRRRCISKSIEAPCVYWPDDGIVPTTTTTQRNIKFKKKKKK